MEGLETQNREIQVGDEILIEAPEISSVAVLESAKRSVMTAEEEAELYRRGLADYCNLARRDTPAAKFFIDYWSTRQNS